MPKKDSKNNNEDKDVSLVTRIIHISNLTKFKHQKLVDIAKKCGDIRTEVWRRYGSISAIGRKPRDIRDEDWSGEPQLSKNTSLQGRIWKAVLSDCLGNIKAHYEACKKKAIFDIYRKIEKMEDKKNLCRLINTNNWKSNKLLSRLMRKYWKHGKNHCFNQIVYDTDSYKVFQYNDQYWIGVMSNEPRKRIAIPLGKYDGSRISGNIRLIIKDNKIEIHYHDDEKNICVNRPCGNQYKELGLDAGYTEIFTDNMGDRYGEGFGDFLEKETDRRNNVNANRNKIRAIINKAIANNDPTKADRILKNNLGRKKQDKKLFNYQQTTRSLVYNAVHKILDATNSIVIEDLTKQIKGDSGKIWNRNFSQWVKGLLHEACESVSRRRGAVFTLVNAAYTSQWIQCDACQSHDFGERRGDSIHCKHCKAVYDTDHIAAVNILQRKYDPEITQKMYYKDVKKILEGRIRLKSTLNGGKTTVDTAPTKTPASGQPSAESEITYYK